MKKIKIFLAFLLSFAFVGSTLVTNVHAADDMDTLVAKLIYYHQNGAETDELRILSSIKEISESEYEKWNSVMETWTWIENDMVENVDVAPAGLPNDNTHAFVVLGFALKENGEMEDELVGRLQVALDSATKYPNSYVLVTGGVIKNGWTEGDRMYEWLTNNGLDSSRIIVEKASSNTAENAAFSFEKLYNDYDINTVSIITSQYHLKRSSILYYTQSLISAETYNKEPIEVVLSGNAGWYREDKTSEELWLKAYSLTLIAGVFDTYSKLTEETAPISVLQDLTVSGDLEYIVGDQLNLTVTAHYDVEEFQRDVTALATIEGYDSNTLGKQTISITYLENDVEKTIYVTVNVSEKKVDTTTPVDTKKDTSVPAGDSTNTALWFTMLGVASILTFTVKRRQSRRS